LPQVLVLSVVEGLTEFLPVSSTGHLVLASKVLNIPQTEFVKSFEIAIQSGAILSVLFLYLKSVLENKKILLKVLWAFIPTSIVGLIFYKLIKEMLIGNTMVTLVALIVGGVFLIIFEKLLLKKEGTKKIENLTVKQSALIGLAQAVAVIPGVSRSAATIIGGMSLGLSRVESAKMSFLLAAPTLLAATTLDLSQNYQLFTLDQLGTLAVGVIASFITATLAIKWFIGYVQTHSLFWFGVYRIILGLLFFLFVGG
jgi:undecaprenyl-diphosphatase